MENNFLKRKLNPFLLITTVMVLAILAGASVIYQQELGELVGTRENLSTQLENTEAELEQAKQNISDLRSTRESLNTEISGLETDLEGLRESKNQRISNLESNLSEVRTERDNFREKFEEQNETRAELEDQNVNLRYSLELVCGDLNETKSTFDECESYGYD